MEVSGARQSDRRYQTPATTISRRFPVCELCKPGKWGSIMPFSFNIEFEPRDLWVGAYWTRKLRMVAGLRTRNDLHLYLTLVPMFPLHIVVTGKPQPDERLKR